MKSNSKRSWAWMAGAVLASAGVVGLHAQEAGLDDDLMDRAREREQQRDAGRPAPEAATLDPLDTTSPRGREVTLSGRLENLHAYMTGQAQMAPRPAGAGASTINQNGSTLRTGTGVGATGNAADTPRSSIDTGTTTGTRTGTDTRTGTGVTGSDAGGGAADPAGTGTPSGTGATGAGVGGMDEGISTDGAGMGVDRDPDTATPQAEVSPAAPDVVHGRSVTVATVTAQQQMVLVGAQGVTLLSSIPQELLQQQQGQPQNQINQQPQQIQPLGQQPEADKQPQQQPGTSQTFQTQQQYQVRGQLFERAGIRYLVVTSIQQSPGLGMSR